MTEEFRVYKCPNDCSAVFVKREYEGRLGPICASCMGVMKLYGLADETTVEQLLDLVAAGAEALRCNHCNERLCEGEEGLCDDCEALLESLEEAK